MPVPTWASLRTRKCSGRSSLWRKLSTIWIIESPVARTRLVFALAAAGRARTTMINAAASFTEGKLARRGGRQLGFACGGRAPRPRQHLAAARGEHHHAAHARALVGPPRRLEHHAREHLPQHDLHL